MKKKILEKKSSKTFIEKHKLKKKWRFWRAYKLFFLRRKRKIFFSKLQKRFDYRRIIRHQFLSTYGKKIYKIVLKKNMQAIFNACFFKFLSMLEMRFSIFLTRIHFCLTNLEAIDSIKKKKFLLNGITQRSYKLLKIGDVIRSNKNKAILFKYRLKQIENFNKNNAQLRFSLFKKHQRRRPITRRRKIQRFTKRKKLKWLLYCRRIKKKRFFFWNLKRSMLVNFAEINYRTRSCIILRNIISGEHWKGKKSLKNKPFKLIKISMLKKVYFLY